MENFQKRLRVPVPKTRTRQETINKDEHITIGDGSGHDPE